MADFSEQQIQDVWNKGTEVNNYDSIKSRKDCVGAWMSREQYGNEESIYGWEIDHVYPESKGGDEQIVNLRPMQWENNRSKDDDYPDYGTVKIAKGNKNIDEVNSKIVAKSLQTKLEKIYNIQ